MEQAKTNFGMRKILALLVSLIAAFSVAGALNLAPISQQVAFADDNVLVVPSANDLKTIGVLADDEAPVYYLEVDKPYESIDFSALGSFSEDGMISDIDGNYYVERTAVDGISSYASSKESIEDAFTLDSDAIEGLDFSSDVYVFWMLDDSYEYYYLVLKMPEKAADVLPCAVTVDGKEITSFVKQADGYTYSGMEYDPTNPEADQYGYVYPKKTADLYTVIVPPMATAADLGFDEGRLVYSYSRDGQYISGWYASDKPTDLLYTGVTSQTVNFDDDKNGEIDVIQVQNPYNADYSGGEVLYAVTFKPAFEVSVDGAAMDLIAVDEGAYKTIGNEYDPTNPEADQYGYVYPEIIADLYTVVVPQGTKTVDMKIATNGLMYNYSATGEFRSGWYESDKPEDPLYTGVTEQTITLDSKDLGEIDVIQVQDPYNLDWTGAALRYAVTFVYERTLSVAKESYSLTYGAKAFDLGAATSDGSAVTYKSSNTKVATVDASGKVAIKGAGSASITVTAPADKYQGVCTKTVKLSVAKAKQTITVSSAKKKAKRGGTTSAISVKGAKTTKTFTKCKGSSKLLSVTKSGKIKVSKKAKKGKTYAIKVKVQAKASANYKASAAKTVTIKVKVK